PAVAATGSDDDGWTVAGLAADEVVAVDIRLRQGERTALLRNNAFYWKGTNPNEVPREVDVELRSGAHRTIKLVAAHPARPERSTR
ncbi:MAG: hypothetical protein H7287_08505, partial [Thermoleophilia bacterium]|nr:hypothetical protein [Thermoleophilia bacterium]